ncbi:hypothetical protein GG851_02615 [Bordetella petrii]|nr:hypothetical protein [Bordetella petrii]
MSPDKRLLAQGLHAYLEGFGRHNEKELAAIAAFEAWGPLAARVYEKRMASVLEALSLEEVQAIARGRIDLGTLAGQVLEGLERE